MFQKSTSKAPRYYNLRTIIKIFLLALIVWNYSACVFFIYDYYYASPHVSTPTQTTHQLRVIEIETYSKNLSSETIIDANGTTDITDTKINQRYCQSDRCKFLFAYYPPEQETQANQHFLSFV